MRARGALGCAARADSSPGFFSAESIRLTGAPGKALPHLPMGDGFGSKRQRRESCTRPPSHTMRQLSVYTCLPRQTWTPAGQAAGSSALSPSTQPLRGLRNQSSAGQRKQLADPTVQKPGLTPSQPQERLSLFPYKSK